MASIQEMIEHQPDAFYNEVDEGANTVLHIACEKNIPEVARLVIDLLFKDNQMTVKNTSFELSLKDYVNKVNSEGLTALHFAAFRGNIELIEYLINLGADPYAKDTEEHNIVHIAAQGDQVAAIHYFLTKYNIDINEKDSRESTALHWAAYLYKEVSLSFLLAWGADIHCQDAEQMTPLHLAVLSSCENEDTRCTKILLLKGADRNKRNEDGKRPIDTVQP
jgi:ankyrin repeat protein